MSDERGGRTGRTESPVRARAHVPVGPAASARWVAAATLLLVPWGLPGASAASGEVGFVRGEVVSFDTGRPVAGAIVRLPAHAVETRSGPNGAFSFSQALPTVRPYRGVDAVVTAPGFGRWTILGAPIPPGDTLQIHAELRATPYSHRVLLGQRNRRASAGGERVSGNTCTGWDYQLVPPPTIKVFISDYGAAKEYDFDFYVAHVLPSEWIPSWDADSLGAGAVAARTYGAYRTMSNHAYSGGAGCADVIDTVADQVFDPSYSTAATDQAVYATFGSILYRGGGLFLSQYYAGYPGQPCAPVEGDFEGRMSQWGTQTCALEGELWPAITTTFYADTYWTYLRNLILNPSASSPAMYAWVGARGTDFARVQGAGYDGNWYITLAAEDPPGKATVYQNRPFNGAPGTLYQSAVAIRCGPENPGSCDVTVKLIGFTESGARVSRQKSVSFPDDGQWRVVTFGPPPFDVAHKHVRLSVTTTGAIGIDAATLLAPYGGP